LPDDLDLADYAPFGIAISGCSILHLVTGWRFSLFLWNGDRDYGSNGIPHIVDEVKKYSGHMLSLDSTKQG